MTSFVTFASHAECQALAVPTELTSVTLVLINHAVALLATLVHQLLAHSSLEETFATFTAVYNASISVRKLCS